MNNIKQIVKKSGSSFFWSMRFLPKAKRNAMYTIYAFCRHLDDVIDGETAMEEKLELIKNNNNLNIDPECLSFRILFYCIIYKEVL